MTGVERCNDYIKYASRKRSHVPQLVRLAVKRHKQDLKRKDIYFDVDAANIAIANIEGFVHARGQLQNTNIVLNDWQCFCVASIFGWKWTHNGLRRFRYATLLVARKNGKSLLAVCIALVMLGLDDEPGAEVYLGATSESQARELLFYPAKYIVENSPDYVDACGLEINASSLVIPSNFSRLKSVIRKVDDGYSPHCAVIDEYHLHDDASQYSSFDTGMGSRRQPLLLIVSTSGSNLAGPCKDERDECVRILEGRAEADSKFALIYEPDETDDWADAKTVRKVNPNIDVSVHEGYLLDQLRQARTTAIKQNDYRTKHLNQWVGARTLWMNQLSWRRQKRDMAMSEFTDVQCHMGVDLASKKDLTAISILFRKEYNYYAFAKFYAPEAAAQENEYYRKFHTSGDLILTPGNMTDYRFVLEDIYELCSRFPVLSIAFDDHQAVFLMTLLQERGLNVVQYPQTTVMMSDPMKEIDARVDNGQLWHDGNPVLTWNMGNVVANENAKQHIYPRRENEKDPKCKIDGVVALIMSMGRWLNDNEPVSYLHNSGVEFI